MSDETWGGVGNATMELREIEMSNRMADLLHTKYTGYKWAVRVNLEGGVVTVLNLMLSGRWGFVIKLSEMMELGDKPLIMAGGELLERYRLRRGALNEGEYMNLKLDHTGNHIPDR